MVWRDLWAGLIKKQIILFVTTLRVKPCFPSEQHRIELLTEVWVKTSTRGRLKNVGDVMYWLVYRNQVSSPPKLIQALHTTHKYLDS